jgi:hypothetical protein
MVSITNSTLGGKSSAAGNVACSGCPCLGQGGALYNDSNVNGSNAPVRLTNDTITFNAAYTSGGRGGGGGIFNRSGTPTLQNDTIKNNTPDNCEVFTGSLTGCKN